MMKIFLLFLMTIVILFGFHSLEHLTINKQDYTLIKEDYKLYDSKGLVMKLYREENNLDLKFVLSLILEDSTGTCGDKGVRKGSYTIEGSQITLYHLFTRVGKAYDSPFGAMKEVYRIENNETVTKIEAKVYIENARKSYDKESGMQYLFKTPQNDAEKEALKAYVESIERRYHASFVYDKEALRLIDEVKQQLEKNIWHKIEQ